MTVFAGWPDIHEVLKDLLEDLAPVVTRTGPDLQENLPTIKISRVGGDDDRFTDRPRVDIDVYHTGIAAALAMAELIRQRLISGPVRTPHGVIDRATTEVGPREIPSADDETVRQANATYRCSLRRRTA